MKLLVVGTGSIGRRHAQNASALAEVGVVDIDHDRARETAKEISAQAFETLARALAWSPRAAVVATPPAIHVSVATELIDAGADVLIEKPIAHELDGVEALLEHADARKCKVLVACNMRFHPGPVTIRANLGAIGRALFARAHFGHYLPQMRPAVDYRRSYCARRAEGGGVCLDGVHEVDYLSWILGPVTAWTGRAAKLSDLDMDVEDYAMLALAHAGGARSEVHLDYLQRHKRRGCEVTGTNGTLLWESEGKGPERCTVRLYRQSADAWETLLATDAVDTNAPYRRLMERFLACVSGEDVEDLLDGHDATHELAVVLQARAGGDTEGVQRVQSA